MTKAKVITYSEQSTAAYAKKAMRIQRGTARRQRRAEAQKILRGKGFHVYWNGGSPCHSSLKAALEYRNET